LKSKLQGTSLKIVKPFVVEFILTIMHRDIFDRLREQQAKLESISSEQGINVTSLVELVKENKIVTEGLKVRYTISRAIISTFFSLSKSSRMMH
jgi:hypothetical protein